MKLWLSLLIIGGALLATVVRANDDHEDGVVTSEEDESTKTHVVEDEETTYNGPKLARGTYHFKEDFDDTSSYEKNWIKSATKKDDTTEDIAQYDGQWAVEEPQRRLFKGDLGLVLKSKVKHAAISSKLIKPFTFDDDKPLVVQYEVQLQDGQDCGGSYLKLLTKGIDDLAKFNDKTPYTIMFGPDKCGNDVHLHFIFRHVNPITGAIEEKHCRKPKERIDEPFKDKQPHLYTLIVRPDNSFTIKFDHRVVNEGNLLTDFTPPVNPEREIDDPNDFKPNDWDERERIPNPDSSKPDDWDEDAPAQIEDADAVKPDGWLDDEEELIYDPTAVKPDDWDTDMDGEFEAPLISNPICEKAVGCGLWKAPMIPNPDFKGKWYAPMIDNPNYRGKWFPARIPNPGFFEDTQPFRMQPITAIGFELWSMSNNMLFDNLLITDDENVAKDFAAQSFDLKQDKISVDAKTMWQRAMRYMNYKPGWWALYFVYCSIPISLYVWYLTRRSKDVESFVTRVLNYLNDNPHMYAVLIVVIGLPVAFVLFFICKESPPKTYQEEALERRKKTDKEDLNEVNEQENNEDEEDEVVEKVQEVDDSTKKGLRNRKKTDKTEKKDELVEDDAEPSASDESDGVEQIPDLIDNNQEEVKTPTPKPESVAANTRKRRTRKE